MKDEIRCFVRGIVFHIHGSRALFNKLIKNKQKLLDTMTLIWYIIARKDESDVLKSLSQPDAEIGITAKRKLNISNFFKTDQMHCKYS